MTDEPCIWPRPFCRKGFAAAMKLTVTEGGITTVDRSATPRRERRAGFKGLALPGMPNLHSHAFQRGMAGLSEARGRDRRIPSGPGAR